MNVKIFKKLLMLTIIVILCIGISAYAENLTYTLEASSSTVYSEPHNIVLSPDGKYLYVSDTANNRIAVLQPGTLEFLGEFGKGELSGPHDAAFMGDGRLLVADTSNNRIAIYSVNAASGRLVGELSGGLRGPEGVAVHPDGRVFATGAWSGNLVIYKDGKISRKTGGFSSPHDVSFDRKGRIWIADAGNNRIVQLSDELKIILQIKGHPFNFNGPRYLDFDSSNRMYVTDKYSNSIKVISEKGKLLKVIGRKRAGKGEGLFDRPEGVEIRGDDIWFSDTYNNRIVRYRLNGK